MIRNVFVTAIIVFAAAKIPAAEPIEVFAGIPPAAYLVERIGGDRLHVEVFIQPGQDPHTFEPAPKQIQALGKAKLFFKTGMPFENQLLEKIRAVHPRLIVVDAAEGIQKRRISAQRAAGDARQDGEHSHGDSPDDLDPHVWLSPPLVKTVAANIASALEKIDPGDDAFFKANLVQLHRELDAVDGKIRLELKPYAGKSFYVFHPAFGYFADCYHLRQEAIEAGGRQPSPKQLRDLVQKAKSDGVRVIFVQPQFDLHSAQTVADAIGGRIVSINDMEKDIPANLQDIAGKIEKAFRESGTAR
ncbi:MAG: zinc ABC transporter substrate-binding protein [Thermoguttaceae bacterium]|jgi:zinc transport system substrate-binding protein